MRRHKYNALPSMRCMPCQSLPAEVIMSLSRSVIIIKFGEMKCFPVRFCNIKLPPFYPCGHTRLYEPLSAFQNRYNPYFNRIYPFVNRFFEIQQTVVRFQPSVVSYPVPVPCASSIKHARMYTVNALPGPCSSAVSKTEPAATDPHRSHTLR